MPRRFVTSVYLLVCLAVSAGGAFAQTHIQPPITPAPSAPLQILPPTISPDLRIVWEVKNRFRLFRKEADFLRHVAAQSIKSVLAAEQIMAAETDGRGWARDMLSNLCIDRMGGVMTTCERDGTRETYLAPADHRVEMRLIGAAPQSTCTWVFDEGDGSPRNFTGPCGEEVRIRLALWQAGDRHGRRRGPNAPPQRAVDRGRGARPVDRRHWRLDRGRRRQSGPADRAVRRGLLLPPLRDGRASTTGPAARRSKATAPAKRSGHSPAKVSRSGRGLARAG